MPKTSLDYIIGHLVVFDQVWDDFKSVRVCVCGMQLEIKQRMPVTMQIYYFVMQKMSTMRSIVIQR